MKKHVLVTLADKNYINQAKQLFSSAYWNGGWDGDYLLLSYNIPEKELKWFREKSIFIYKCKKLQNESNIKINEFNKEYINPVYLCKFYLFTDYFKKWSNIVFLDADIIVLASIRELKNIKDIAFTRDLSPKLVQHFIEKKYIKNPEEKIIFNILSKKYSLEEKTLSSGVIVFKGDIIKENTFENLLRLYFFYRNIIIYPEQAIFNLYFYKKWRELPLVYNACSTLFGIDEKINAIILHTIAHDKAWYEYSRFTKEWKENLEKAEDMNIKNPKNPKKIFLNNEIKINSRKIEKKMFPEEDKIVNIFRKIDKSIGLFGIYLKKIYPKLYFFLKIKFKNLISFKYFFKKNI